MPIKNEEVKVVATQEYELVFIVKPDIVDEQLENTINAVSQLITSKGGEVSGIDQWGKKKLAYPIKHSLEGTYVLAKIKLAPQYCKEVEASLQISESILRHLLVKVE
jgi:small subunit ribosomal protein S6